MLQFRSTFSAGVCLSQTEDEWRIKNCEGYTAGSVPRIQITYLGVWDTVGALGIPTRYTLLSPFNRKLQFHDTALSPFVKSARHAIAIDERRKDFVPTLWENVDHLNRVAGEDGKAPDAPYQEKWFPGTHSSVGGGGDRRGLSDQALAWVLDGAQHAGLELDGSERTPIYGLKPNSREFLQDTAEPGFFYKAMNALAAADRMPGPASINEVSISARRRWKEKADDLLDKKEYRPGTLKNVAAQLDALSAADVGLGLPTAHEGSYTLYLVKRGDALRKIAKEQLGDANKASDIYDLNRDKLESPDLIYVGQTLRLPGKPSELEVSA